MNGAYYFLRPPRLAEIPGEHNGIRGFHSLRFGEQRNGFVLQIVRRRLKFYW